MRIAAVPLRRGAGLVLSFQSLRSVLFLVPPKKGVGKGRAEDLEDPFVPSSAVVCSSCLYKNMCLFGVCVCNSYNIILFINYPVTSHINVGKLCWNGSVNQPQSYRNKGQAKRRRKLAVWSGQDRNPNCFRMCHSTNILT